MKVGLFIPCYVNQFYPEIGIATLELLESLGLEVTYPVDQTCCGQPMANSGYEHDAIETYRLFVKNFQDFDYIVAPSGSCAYHVKKHFDILDQHEEVLRVRNNTFELCDFLVNVLKKDDLGASFPHKVGLHQSCHGQRGLRLGKSSELVGEEFSVLEQLLKKVEGLQLVKLARRDECCGFGGTFAVSEETISVKMGRDRIRDHLENGVQVITATDASCLMHLEGIVKREKLPLSVKHIALILNSVNNKG